MKTRSRSTLSHSTATASVSGKKEGEAAGEGIRDKKRKQPEVCTADGWSAEQEASLRKAFLAAKPTPRFWKDVARLVTGKSAQECFDKIHSSVVTPPHRQPRSRVSKTNSSPLGHFPISASQKDLASPLVLKPVENKALHDKYIDQLRRREARRKVASSSVAEHTKDNHVQITRGVKEARNALNSIAQDMINKFNLEAAVLSNDDDFDEDDFDEDEEGDDLL